MIRIAIVGPESTGKSTLAAQLAKDFNTLWVPEVARGYLENLSRPYNASDVVQIAKQQMTLEDQYATQTSNLLFCDTNLLVNKIWMLNAYGYCDSWINKEMEKRSYDLCLLTNIDLPWEPDPLREHPNQRQYFFDWYKRELENAGEKFYVISGTTKQRVNNAKSVVLQNFPLLKSALNKE